jgi:hypothetical protein
LPHPTQKNVGFLRKPYSTEALLLKLREVVFDDTAIVADPSGKQPNA